MSQMRLDAMTPPTIREQLDRVRQLEWITLEESCLLVSVCKSTLRRRLGKLDAADLLRDGRIVRVRRVAVVRLFRGV